MREKLPVDLPKRYVEVSILDIQGCEPVALSHTLEQRSDSEHSEFPCGNKSKTNPPKRSVGCWDLTD